MKKFYLFLLLFLVVFASNSQAQNVIVNPGAGSYPTLKDAFDAINAGTHTGAITIDIVGNTMETATAILNASGGTSNYTSVVIKPNSSRVIQGTIAGAIIKLAGADNVTIDGRVGISDFNNLFITNLSTATASACIWLSHGSGAANDSLGAKNNVIRNCILKTSVQLSLSTNNSFCIISSGLTISSSSQARNNDSNTIIKNHISHARYGICVVGGGATNLNDNNRIDFNKIGDSLGTFVTTNIGRVGIFVTFQNNCSVSKNKLHHIGGSLTRTTAGADRVGIGIGAESWSIGNSTTTTGTNYTVNGNVINGVREGRTFSAIGILCATTASGPPTGNIITNNVIYDVMSNATSPDITVGIAHSGNRGDLIAYNSIYIAGDLDPTGESSAPASRPAVGIEVGNTTGDTALTIKNNSIYVDCTSDTMTLPTSYAIVMPNGYGWGTGGEDNNNYYFASNPLGMIGALRSGTGYPFSSTFNTLAGWQTAFTPAQDVNSISSDPLYSLPPTLHLLMPQFASPLKTAGIPLASVTNDILYELRSAFQPTIGAYEYDSITLPVELSAFSASVNNHDVILSWTTASELNNSGFDIERKAANSSWIKIGNVPGNGTTTIPSYYSFTDKSLSTGRYNYRLKQIDFNGHFEYFNLSNDIVIGIPSKYNLSQNYPNPFNPSTKINFDLPFDGNVSLKIFDISGREVATILNEFKPAGYYSIDFNTSSAAGGLSSGAYFYKITTGNFTDTKKMMIIK